MLRGARCPAENLCCMVQASGEGALLVCFLDHGFPQVKCKSDFLGLLLGIARSW